MKSNLVDHPIVVGNPDRMIRDDQSGDLICPECYDAFSTCPCPKPWSSIETDGFQIMIEDDMTVAYPTEETYTGEMLWITGTFHRLLCVLCGKTMETTENLKEIEANEIVEAFFEIHQQCYDG